MGWLKQSAVGYRLVLVLVLVLSVAIPVAKARAEMVTFTIDPNLSSLALSGSYAGFELVSQDPPADTSMSAIFGGTVLVDVDDPLAPSLIEFLSGSVEATDSGSWLPAIGGGSEGDPELGGDSDPGDAEPANYGIYVDADGLALAWGALRDLVFSPVSDFGEPESISNSRFSSNQVFSVVAGTFDSTVQSAALGDSAGTDDITGETTFNDAVAGSYVVNEIGLATLTIPVDMTFLGNVELRFVGTLIGTASVGAGLVGDYDQNGQLDSADLDLQAAAMTSGTNPPEFDLNGDGVVNFDDRVMWVSELKGTWIGDANLDGEFNSDDFVLVFTAGKYETGQVAGWSEGDWQGDLVFDSGDFVAAFTDGGYELGPRPPAAPSVPEPSGIVLLTLALLCTKGGRSLSRRTQQGSRSAQCPEQEKASE